jgi:sugar phosphate isomerase/epimerase
MRPQLHVYQSLWAMEFRQPGIPELSLEECFRRVHAAGFNGIAIDLGATDIETAKRCAALLVEYKLGCMINAFPRSVEDLRAVFDLSNYLGAKVVNVIGQQMPVALPECIKIVELWMLEAETAGVELLFETHRNSLLNDLYYILQIMDSVPHMKICADLSHILVDREFRYPISPEADQMIDSVLRRSKSFQGRIATREQVQIPIGFPHHRKWVELFRTWWERGFRYWLETATPTDTLIFLCELGPPDYAITGPDGRELSDRWQEALMIKGWVEDIWRRVSN